MITRETVRHVAELAKLHFSEEELDVFVEEFRKIVAYVNRLSEVDMEEADTWEEPAVSVERTREDRAVVWPGARESLANAPERLGPLFSVPSLDYARIRRDIRA